MLRVPAVGSPALHAVRTCIAGNRTPTCLRACGPLSLYLDALPVALAVSLGHQDSQRRHAYHDRQHGAGQRQVEMSEALAKETPTKCTPRDYVQYRRVKVLEDLQIRVCPVCPNVLDYHVKQDGTILISLRSANHPNMPEKNGSQA